MSQVKKAERTYFLAIAMSLAVFAMGQIPGSIDAAISKISIAFNLSSTTGLYISTISCLTSVAFSILLGFIAGKKIGFKPLILFCAIVELFSAIFPFFLDNYVLLLIVRGLFGIGFGGMMSMENTVAALLIPEEKRARILGLGMFCGFGMNCILQIIGGIFADFGWNYVFLNHILLIFPFIFIVLGCTRLDFGPRVETGAPTEQKKEKEKSKLPGGVFQIWIMMLFIGCMISPLLIGCSFLSEAINSTAKAAGIVAACFSIGCMIGGLVYPSIYKKIKRFALPFFLVVMAAGMFASALAGSIPVLCVAIFIAGMGMSMTQSTGMMILSISTSSARVAFASAIMMALFNFGLFFSSTFENIVGKITGDSLYIPLYIGAVIMVIFAIVYAIVTPLPASARKAAE